MNAVSISLKCIFPPSSRTNPSDSDIKIGPERSGALISSSFAPLNVRMATTLFFISYMSRPMST